MSAQRSHRHHGARARVSRQIRQAIALVRPHVTRTRAVLAAAVLVALIVGGIVLLPQRRAAAPVAPGPPHVSLRQDGPIAPSLAGLVVAARAGLFEREGLLVEFMPGGPEADPIEKVASGADTIGLVAADRFLVARGKGSPIVAFAAGYLESPTVFYLPEASGIRTPRDFPGRRVGYQAGTHTALVYEALMAKLELPRNRMQEVAVGADPAPLLEGKVDVWPGSIGQAWTLRQRNFAYAVIAPINFGIHMPGTVYFATEKTLRDHPALIRQFVRALIAGWNQVYADPAASIPLIASYDEWKLTPDRLRFELDQQREFIRPLAMRFAEFNQTQWRALREILLRQKLMAESVDLSTAVSYEFLREAYRKPGSYAK
jgi:ABC-type nitrate/sulfonate/bicarbonate transport system substrate-binding protein